MAELRVETYPATSSTAPFPGETNLTGTAKIQFLLKPSLYSQRCKIAYAEVAATTACATYQTMLSSFLITHSSCIKWTPRCTYTTTAKRLEQQCETSTRAGGRWRLYVSALQIRKKRTASHAVQRLQEAVEVQLVYTVHPKKSSRK